MVNADSMWAPLRAADDRGVDGATTTRCKRVNLRSAAPRHYNQGEPARMPMSFHTHGPALAAADKQ